MKTIRTNCFETNSSSTHSVTIRKAKVDEHGDARLVIDGVLHPENLVNIAGYLKVDYSNMVLTCSTRDEKAALFVDHTKSLMDNFGIEDMVYLDMVVYRLKQMLGYSGVNTEYSYNFNGSCENYDSYIEDIFGDLEEIEDDPDFAAITEAINEHIRDVILNDTAVIVEQESPY